MPIAATSKDLHKLTTAVDKENGIALLDSGGKIVAINEQWTRMAKSAGFSVSQMKPGMNYLDISQRDNSIYGSRSALNGIRSLLKGKTQSFTMDCACETGAGQKHFRLLAASIQYGIVRVVVAFSDITDVHLSKERSLERVRHFARRMVTAQEEERQKIAREIHDDLGNRIAVLAFSIEKIMAQPTKPPRALMRQLSQVVDGFADFSKVLRELTHSLHPPLLRHSGICAALKALCKEFERTRAVPVEMVFPSRELALPDEVGLCLFRIAQECFQNVAKHSGAQSMTVVLERSSRQVRLKISDTGCGFDQSEAMQKGGLGLLSIQERALCIHGQLEVNTAPGAGTTIQVTIPLPYVLNQLPPTGVEADFSETGQSRSVILAPYEIAIVGEDRRKL